MATYEKSFLLSLYRDMVRIRAFEEHAAECFTKGMLAGNIHLSIGQEAADHSPHNVHFGNIGHGDGNFRGLPHGLHQRVLRDAGVFIAAAVCRGASAGQRQRRADLRFCQSRQQLLYRRGFPFGGSFQDVNALHTGIRSQCKPGFVHSRHGGNAQIDPGLSGRGDHPRAADGRVRFSFQKQRVDGIVFCLPRHQLYEFQVVSKRILHGLRVGEWGAAAVNDGAAEAMDPGGGIVGGAVLLHEAVAPPAGIVLHIGVKFFRRGGNLAVLHITAVIHEQQRFIIDRKLINSPLIGSCVYGIVHICGKLSLRNDIRNGCKNSHFCINPDLIMGKQIHIRCCLRIISDHLQCFCQITFLFQNHMDLRL